VVPIGLFFGRLANFINGELFGRITTVPWAVNFPQGGGFPRHPSQLYEAILEGLLLWVILFIIINKPALRLKHGLVLGLFLVGYGLSRFGVEFLREPDPQIGLMFDYLSMGQILCIPMMIAGGCFIYHAFKRHQR
jgi:phosphatidylglycerol:prolipoprotein diacylglycerol transferase